MVYCYNCGVKLKRGSKTCHKCGINNAKNTIVDVIQSIALVFVILFIFGVPVLGTIFSPEPEYNTGYVNITSEGFVCSVSPWSDHGVIDDHDVVVWTNYDNKTHRVVSDYGWFDSGDLEPGQSYSYQFNGSGAFPFHCAYNLSMKGTIHVDSGIS